MMNFQSRIERSILKSKHRSGVDIFHEVCFVLAKEFGWSYNDISTCPIPFVLGTLNELDKFRKLEEAARKRRK